MLNRLILLLSFVAIIIVIAMINLTTPSSAGPLGVLVFFTAIYVVVFAIATAIIFLFRKTMGKKNEMRRKDYCYAMMLAFGPIMLLLMQSFGSLSLFTIGLVAVFVLLGCFLVNKRV